MKLRSGRIVKLKRKEEEQKRSKAKEKRFASINNSNKKQIKQKKRPEKYVNATEIEQIIKNSLRLVVRMSSKRNLNELHGVNSQNSNNTTENQVSDSARGSVHTIDNDILAEALQAQLPDYSDDEERQQQNVQPQPNTNRKKMTELLARPSKLRLDGNVADNWKHFRRQLDIFMIASEYNNKSSEVKTAVVLNLIGQDAIDLFDTFDLNEEQKKDYDEVLKAFDVFCKPKTNELYERYIFNKRDQKDGESFDAFLMDIKRLARTCEYKETEEMMLRDRIVFGIFNGKLRTKLLETQNLTYAMAVDKCRADEATHGYATDMNKTTHIDELKRDGVRKNSQPTQQQQQQQQQNKQNKKVNNARRGQQQQQQQRQMKTQTNERYNRNQNNGSNGKIIENCTRCTFSHKINECPAYGKNCNKCSRPNHFSNACRERKVTTIATNYKEYRVNLDDEFAIDTLENDNDTRETDDAVVYPWIEKLFVNKIPVSFKIDSGAEIDVLPLSKLRQLNDRIELQRTDIKLRGFGGNRVQPIGMYTLPLRFNNVILRRQVAIVEFDQTQILGYYSAVKFGIIKKSKTKSLDSINEDL